MPSEPYVLQSFASGEALPSSAAATMLGLPKPFSWWRFRIFLFFRRGEGNGGGGSEAPGTGGGSVFY